MSSEDWLAVHQGDYLIWSHPFIAGNMETENKILLTCNNPDLGQTLTELNINVTDQGIVFNGEYEVNSFPVLTRTLEDVELLPVWLPSDLKIGLNILITIPEAVNSTISESIPEPVNSTISGTISYLERLSEGEFLVNLEDAEADIDIGEEITLRMEQGYWQMTLNYSEVYNVSIYIQR